jgi:TatD DNase family protein
MPLVFFDAHAHINFQAYKDDAPEVIRRAYDAGVAMLVVGSQIDTSRRAVSYAETYPSLWAVVGLHPIHLVDTYVDLQEVGEEGTEGVAFHTRSETFNDQAYRELAQHPRTVGIGECGIDYYRIPERENASEVREKQLSVFRSQITLAQDLALPLMVHVRNGDPEEDSGVWAAHEDTINVLATMYEPWDRVRPRGMIHCYSGTWEQSERYLNLGFNLSFTGVITFVPSKRWRDATAALWESVRRVPMDRFHVETDSPYLTPAPHRGKQNEPQFVRHVAEKVAELRGVSVEEVARATTENTLQLFHKIDRDDFASLG